jgi:hypothetical protein
MGILIAATKSNIPQFKMIIDDIIFGLVVRAYKAIKIKIKELNPKIGDKMNAKTWLFQKNCPTRQINKGTKKQTRKIIHPSVYPFINPLVISNNKYPIETTKTISCQNFTADFKDFIFSIFLTY